MIKEIKGKILKSITIDDSKESALFETMTGQRYMMYHEQDCCEHVYIDEICGDLSDLIGSEILTADERTSDDNAKDPKYDESFTWTFYEIATIKGNVTIKWYGTSNGYYSERVRFIKLI